MMKAAGVHYIRNDFSWSAVEKKRGVFRIPPNFAGWIHSAEGMGIQPIIILDYGNPIYPNQGIGSASNPKTSFPEYLNYVRFVVTHLRGIVHWYEIWNEPDGFTFNTQYGGDWRGGGWVKPYCRLANETAALIHQLDPKAQVLTGGMEAVIAQQCVPYWKNRYDYLAIHPYCIPFLPEYEAGPISVLRQEMKRTHFQAGLLATEQGWSTGRGIFPLWDYHGEITLRDQAKFLLRSLFYNFSDGLRLTCWYDFLCDGSDPNNWEDNFGIVNANGTPRPAYTALLNLTHALGKPQNIPAANLFSKPLDVMGILPSQNQLEGVYLQAGPHRFLLCLWEDTPTPDRFTTAGPDTARPFRHDDWDRTLTLQLPLIRLGVPTVKQMDPLVGPQWHSAKATPNGMYVQVSGLHVNDHPTVIELDFPPHPYR